MEHPIHCPSCGHEQTLPLGYARPKFRCASCGTLQAMPAARGAPRANPAAVPRPTPGFDLFGDEGALLQGKDAAAAPDSPGDRELLIQGTTNEEDTNPYTVRGDAPIGACPACGQPLFQRFSVCKHCGVDLAASAKQERVFTPVDQTWDNGWTLQKRMTLFLVLQVVNLLLMVGPWLAGRAAGWHVSGTLVNVALQAFILGTFDRLRLTRSAKGKVALTRTWRVAFCARRPRKIRWSDCEGVRLAEATEHATFDWMIGLLLFLYGILPGIIFWRYVLSPNLVDVALCKDHGTPTLVLCRTANRERAKEIAESLHDATGLPILP